MNATLINGCNENNLFHKKISRIICEHLDNKAVNYHMNYLNKINPRCCIGCDSCQTLTPGICAINDGINDILKQYLHGDIAIIITPIQFGLCNSVTKNFIDRTEPLFLPYQISKKGKTLMKSRYDNYPDIIFIGIINDNDLDSIETFKDTMINSNLSSASNKVSINIIKGNCDDNFDLESLKLI